MRMTTFVTKAKFSTSLENYRVSLSYEGIILKNNKKNSISELKRKYAR